MISFKLETKKEIINYYKVANLRTLQYSYLLIMSWQFVEHQFPGYYTIIQAIVSRLLFLLVHFAAYFHFILSHFALC